MLLRCARVGPQSAGLRRRGRRRWRFVKPAGPRSGSRARPGPDAAAIGLEQLRSYQQLAQYKLYRNVHAGRCAHQPGRRLRRVERSGVRGRLRQYLGQSQRRRGLGHGHRSRHEKPGARSAHRGQCRRRRDRRVDRARVGWRELLRGHHRQRSVGEPLHRSVEHLERAAAHQR